MRSVGLAISREFATIETIRLLMTIQAITQPHLRGSTTRRSDHERNHSIKGKKRKPLETDP